MLVRHVMIQGWEVVAGLIPSVTAARNNVSLASISAKGPSLLCRINERPR